jgi:predicted phosphodiesterase
MGTMRLENLCERQGGDILLFGHTHERYEKYVDVEEKYSEIVKSPEKIKELKNYYLFNPGSAGGYNGSYGILTLTENTVLFSHGR